MSEAHQDEAETQERPLFARSYPEDAALLRLLAAFEAGNYAHVREEAPRLAEQSTDAEVKRAALDLRRRVDPPPFAVALIALGFALLVYFVYFYFSHQHEVVR